MTEAKYEKVPVWNDEESPNKVTFHVSTYSKKRKRVLIITLLMLLVLAVIIAIIVLVLLAKKGKDLDMGVASDNDVCTQIGGDILAQNGSAVDAAIATLLCLGAVQPQSNGIGGGGFMLVHSMGTNGSKVINFRETAPKLSTKEMYIGDKKLATIGGLAVGVPGEIRGYQLAHERYGRLNWSVLFEPSIKILRNGITVTEHLGNALTYMKTTLAKDDNFKSIFFNADGSTLKVGDTFTNTMLADTYEAISKDADAFYTGLIADNIIAALKATGGIMELEDLENYKADLVEPIELTYKGRKTITAPPPASGHVISLVLQQLDGIGLPGKSSTRAWNVILEAFRHGYAARSQSGDIEFSDKTKWVVERINNGSLATSLLKTYFSNALEEDIIPGDIASYGEVYENYDGTHTTHVSVLGPDGEAVSCTSTVNLYFGSCVMSDDGIVLNDEMDDFSTPGVTNAFGFAPSPENFIVPGKSPMSSSSPVIVLDSSGERAEFVTGAAGGSRIITGALLSIINALDWEMTLKDNIDARRIHDQLNGFTYYEGGVDSGLISGLSEIGYNMTLKSSYMSVVTSVSNLRDETEALGDTRKAGTGRVVKKIKK